MKIYSLCAAVLIVCSPAAVRAQPSPALDGLSEPALKALYLHCDRESAKGRLDQAFAVFCVAAGDELRSRVFGGSFEQLLAWWRSTRETERSAKASR
jgi:hypothetical protein